MIDDTSGERHIRNLSQLSWVQVDKDRYILSTQSGDYITMERHHQKAEMYHVMYTQRIRALSEEENKHRAPYMRPREVAQGVSLADVVRAADTFALEKFPRQFITHAMPWRKQPASEGQLFFLNKFRDVDDKLTTDKITKGKAGDLITKIKFGARGRFKQIDTTKKTLDRQTNKRIYLQQLRDRESVKVGPLVEPVSKAIEAALAQSS